MADENKPPQQGPASKADDKDAEIAALKGEVAYARRAADDLQGQVNKLKGRAPAPAADAGEVAELRAANILLRDKYEGLAQTVAAERGPEEGTPVCYQGTEPFCRPAVIKSQGFSHREPTPSGFLNYATVEYGDPSWLTVDDREGKPVHQKHTFEKDVPWNALGAPNSFHCVDECPRVGQKLRDGTPVCPYGESAAKDTAARLAKVQAP